MDMVLPTPPQHYPHSQNLTDGGVQKGWEGLTYTIQQIPTNIAMGHACCHTAVIMIVLGNVL